METFIFAVGFFVTLMVIYGIFSLVPREIRPPERDIYRKTGKAKIKRKIPEITETAGKFRL